MENNLYIMAVISLIAIHICFCFYFPIYLILLIPVIAYKVLIKLKEAK